MFPLAGSKHSAEHQQKRMRSCSTTVSRLLLLWHLPSAELGFFFCRLNVLHFCGSLNASPRLSDSEGSQSSLDVLRCCSLAVCAGFSGCFLHLDNTTHHDRLPVNLSVFLQEVPLNIGRAGACVVVVKLP